MGTDIHLHVEARGTEGNVWRRFERNITYNLDRRATAHVQMGWGEGRNYDVFAMMADVRNGRGFAGVDLGYGFIPIAEPRGLPEDCDYAIDEEAENWGVDGHSHSYLTLRELLDLEHNGYWEHKTEHRGVMMRAELEQAKADGLVVSVDGQKARLTSNPRSWAGDISGPDPTEIFRASWEGTYRESGGWLLNTTIPLLIELGSTYALTDFFGAGVKAEYPNEKFYPVVITDPSRKMDHWIDIADRIRLVFWFDN